MALIIETGSIVAGADSFATVAEFATYAGNYGRAVPSDDEEVEALLRRAALQMDALAWNGALLSPYQSLSWPRYGVMIDGWAVPSNEVPAKVKLGQMALAAEIYADDSAPAELKSGPIIREKVGPLETEYGDAPRSLTKPVATRQSTAFFASYTGSPASLAMVRA